GSTTSAPQFLIAAIAASATGSTSSQYENHSRTTPMRHPRSARRPGETAKSGGALHGGVRAPRSSASGHVRIFSRTARSATPQAIGPAVSMLCAIGRMPRREISPRVGLRPAMPQDEAGLTIDPSVSVPTASGPYPAATAAADPEL